MENTKISMNGYRLDTEIRNVPVSFVNGLRRILLAELPVVVVRDVQILDNNTQMVHEMVRHRIEMLPINVRPDESGVIRDTKLECRFLPHTEPREVSSDDFAVLGPRQDVILKDRELGTPLLFMNLRANESLHVKAALGIGSGSQVCVSTFRNHIDDTVAKIQRDEFILNGGDPREFDVHHIQRYYSKDEKGRPNWFDFAVESIGVIPAVDLFKQAVTTLQTKVNEWAKTAILRESEGWYRMENDSEGHTVGRLAQEMIYKAGLVEFVAYDIPHPLLPKMVLRFQSKMAPEAVIERFRTELNALCESLLASK